MVTDTAHLFPWERDNEPRARFPVYTRGNIAEVFPNPVSPLIWSSMTIPGTEPGWRDAWESLGAFDRDEFNPERPEVLDYFGGYLYLNLSVLRTFAVRAPGFTPELMDAGVLGDHPDVPPYRVQPGDESEEHTGRIGATLAGVLATEAIPPAVHEMRRREEEFVRSRPDLGSASDQDLVAYFRAAMAETRPTIATQIVMTMSASVAVGVVSTVCSQVLGDPAAAFDLLSGIGEIASAAPSFDLWEVSRIVAASPVLMAEFDRGVPGLLDRLHDLPEASDFLKAFQAVVGSYPFRGPDEYNFVAPTWETCPELAIAAIDRMRLVSENEAPNAKHGPLAAQRRRCTEEVLAKLESTPEVAQQLAAGIKAAQALLAAREASRINLVMPIHESRLALRELGSRMVERGHLARWEDLQVLESSELEAFLEDPGSFHEVVKHRAEAFAGLADLIPPFIIDGNVPATATWQRKSDSAAVGPVEPGTVLQGMGGCAGQATGIARIILDALTPEGLLPGEILVAPLTDPAWTPLFVPAAAVVVETGAVISHAMIVSRELGIPCVVSLTDATRKIRDGATITVDGLAGTVTVHD